MQPVPSVQGCTNSPRPIRVLLLDDNADLRRGVARSLSAASDVQVVGEVGNIKEARAALAALRPDVAVLDAQLPDGTGLQLCRDVRSTYPGTACIILTAFDQVEAQVAAVIAGAAAYLNKDRQTHALADAIRAVASGSRLHDEDLLRATQRVFSASHAPVGHLSERERRIAELMASGYTNSQIAEITGLPEPTVRTYSAAIASSITGTPVPAEPTRSSWWRPRRRSPRAVPPAASA